MLDKVDKKQPPAYGREAWKYEPWKYEPWKCEALPSPGTRARSSRGWSLCGPSFCSQKTWSSGRGMESRCSPLDGCSNVRGAIKRVPVRGASKEVPVPNCPPTECDRRQPKGTHTNNLQRTPLACFRRGSAHLPPCNNEDPNKLVFLYKHTGNFHGRSPNNQEASAMYSATITARCNNGNKHPPT